MSHRRDDDLAYGDYHDGGAEGERGFIGDQAKRLFSGRKHEQEQSNVTQTYQPHLNQQQQQSSHHQGSSSNEGGMSFVFDKLHTAVHSIGSDIKDKLSGREDTHEQSQQSQHGQSSGQQFQAQGAQGQSDYHSQHRFLSFAPERQGNDIKWFVDGCGYMWAVSVALERARESIWILDWWLSPELYLRRPPAKYEQYRIDRMLEAAAQRGVKVNIIVYKEVTQALTLSSAHTKHALEKLHPNIAVFRHPDHLPDQQALASSFFKSLQSMTFNTASLSQLPGDSIKAIYGVHEDTVLYWAHHEKLCVVDGQTAFMGGLDLCYGRWDTNQHPIADAHPSDLDKIVFPGQDYNNARIMDFQDPPNWQANKLDRTQSSRMGWSDISLSLHGAAVQDLKTHFVERWNFIYNEKYNSRKDERYSLLSTSGPSGGQNFPPPPTQQYRGADEGEGQRGFGGDDYEESGEGGERGLFGSGGHHGGFREKLTSRVEQYGHHGQQQQQHQPQQQHEGYQQHQQQGHGSRSGVSCQITRSCAKWSHGVPVEHSIQNAYCEIIKNSQHFIYIENQFFITATVDEQKPIKNKIASAIVERIVRAAKNGEKYKMIVMIPSVPAFPGDLKSDDALGTRAIMEFQYNSINRGGNSIYESIAKAGYNPLDYIRFYNLRSYDRINASGAMRDAEHRSGVPYEQAREAYDNAYGGVYQEEKQQQQQQQYQAYRPPPQELEAAPPRYELDAGYGSSTGHGKPQDAYQQYQQGAAKIGSHHGLGTGRWDSVSECYMLGGEDIRNVPWEGGEMNEMDAFVSEELYVHSKLLIADDQTVICGSANLNDRSQLGDHDSEIAIIVQDSETIDSHMDGRPWRAAKFAASLRRQIFRKHLGLLRPQDMERPDQNFEPIGVPNVYDWGSEEDRQVTDPLSDDFQGLWNWRAKTNTDAFAKLFHPVPYDGVRNWKEYDEYYERFFHQEEKDKDKDKKPSQYKWGHVVAENFSQGPQGIKEVKEVLSTIKGTLVEMPLLFLKDEDIAKEGLGLNAFTEEIYT